MQIQRVPSLLQGVAEVRNWVVHEIPSAASTVGYDLFLKIGSDFFSGRPLSLATLTGELPYLAEEVREHTSSMMRAGLLAQLDGALVPTDRFVGLLKQYQSKCESVFILRKDLRERQLLVQVGDQRLQDLVTEIYDHFHDLGWVYLHNFGGVCFLMASLVRRVAQAHGFQARVESCHVRISAEGRLFSLGGPGHAKPGQIEGHAACIIEDKVLVDFGLGNVRRGYRRDFYWGVACPYEVKQHVIAQLDLPLGETVAWLTDWQTPDGPAELAKYEGLVGQLLDQYLDRYS